MKTTGLRFKTLELPGWGSPRTLYIRVTWNNKLLEERKSYSDFEHGRQFERLRRKWRRIEKRGSLDQHAASAPTASELCHRCGGDMIDGRCHWLNKTFCDKCMKRRDVVIRELSDAHRAGWKCPDDLSAMMGDVRRRWPKSTIEGTLDYGHVVTVPEVRLPDGWEPNHATLVLKLPCGFPSACPGGFWTRESNLLHSGMTPHYSHREEDGMIWATDVAVGLRFGWVPQAWSPRSSISTWLNVCRARFSAPEVMPCYDDD